ncbi:MAG: hypothetical protein J6B87_01635 [Clostridia bacterium]|nr:hypothetical protein [Clostridia bacterium]
MNKQQTEENVKMDDFKLLYSLTEAEIELEGEKYITYGIEVEKQSLKQNEKSTINNISMNKARVKEIMKILERNEVTPVHLYDVMENFL